MLLRVRVREMWSKARYASRSKIVSQSEREQRATQVVGCVSLEPSNKLYSMSRRTQSSSQRISARGNRRVIGFASVSSAVRAVSGSAAAAVDDV